MELTKYNTALDLLKLTDEQITELIELGVDVLLSVKIYPILFCSPYMNDYLQTETIRRRDIVPFEQFKSIHFTEPSREQSRNDTPSSRRQEDDIPSYEELVEALKDLVSLKEIKDTQGKTQFYNDNQTKAWDKAKQLLERIK